MPRIQTPRPFSFRKNSKLTKSTRHVVPLLIAGVAVMAAVVFSVTVESRRGAWLWKAQPSTSPKASGAAEVASKPSTHSNTNPNLGPGPRLAAPVAPTVTATKKDSLFTDVDMDNKADPGDTLKYNVVIGSTGADATGVMFTDTVDPNTAIVTGSTAASPVAADDTFPVTVAGNVRINSANLATPFSVVSNDYLGFNPTATISAFDATTANGGQVVMTTSGADMGKFTYNPPPGFEGTDTFTYTLSDNANITSAASNRTATVSITVSGMIWFINNAASCPCDGRLTNPFNTLAAFDAINDSVDNVPGHSFHPATNDNIFVYESGTDYVGPVTLENGQRFIGQDATATISAITGITPPTGSDSLPPANPGANIVNITGNGITVGSGNTLRGFTGGNSTSDINGTNFGTLNISEVTLNGTGNALNLATGTLNGSFGSISSTNSAITGISLSGVGGSLTTGSTTVTNPTGIGISASGGSATLSFAATSVTGSGDTAISLTTNSGAITFGALTITPDASKRGLLATDNSGTITIPSGTVSTSGATAVEITRGGGNTTPLNVSLTTVSANGGSRGIMLSNTSGSFTITGTGGTCINGNTAGCSGGTIASSTGADDSTTTPGGTGVVLNNATNVSLTRMFIHDHSNYGIRGTSVTGFTLDNSVLNGTNGTDAAGSAASPFNEGTIKIDNLAGSATISNTFVSGGISNNVRIDNTSATVNRVTFTNDTIGANSTNNGEDGILLESENTGRVLATIQNTTFTSARGDLFNFVDNAASGSADDLIFNSNVLSNNHPAIATGGGGVTISSNGTKDFTFHMESNTMRDAVGHALLLVKSTGAASYSGTFTGNSVGLAATANSGSKEGDGIKVQNAGQGTVTVAITNNNIHQYNNFGIELLTGGGATAQSGALNATITGNTIDSPGNTAGTLAIPKNGVHLNAGTVVGDTYALCVDINNNHLASSGADAVPAVGGGQDIRLRQRQSTTVRLPGYAGGATDDAAVAAFEVNQNFPAEAPTAIASHATGWVTPGGAACTAPTTGPITAASTSSNIKTDSTSSLSADSVTRGVQTGVERGESTLYAAKGENPDAQHVLKLSESEVAAIVQTAIARWADAGLSAADVAKLQSLSFEVADLPAGQLATATSSRITLDETAAGYGWFLDTTPSDDNEFDVPVQDKERQTTETSAANGRMDLLTVLMRELGSQLNPGKSGFQGSAAWLMQGTLSTDTRRAPAFKFTVGKVKSAPNPTVAKQVPTATETQKGEASYQQVAWVRSPRSSRVLRNHAMRSAAPTPAVPDVSLSIGTIPAGKSVNVVFRVTINNPFLGTTPQVSNQGTVSGGFTSVLTDDPDTGALNDPTITQIDRPDTTVTSINRSGSDPTNASSVSWTVTFADGVRNLASSNFTLVPTGLGGTPGITTVTAVGSEPATQWTVTATTGTGDGTLGLNMTNDTGALSHDVTNLPFTGQVYTIDRTPPTVSMSSVAPNPTNTSPIVVTVLFSETVTGFTASDIVAGNGTVGNFSGSGANYSFDLTPTGQGLVTADIAAGVATDTAGNGNTAATQFSRTFDTVSPSVTINQASGQADPTNVSPINFTAVFSEPVTGFTNADVTVGGTANPTTAVVTEVAPNNGTTYNVAVSGMTASGTVTASIPSGAATDGAGNTSTASTSTDNTVTFDNSVPSVTINQASGQADPTNASPINFTVVFSESVTGFTNADVTLGGTAGATTAVVTQVAPNDGTTYNVAVSGMTSNGTVTASIPAGAATDGAGNANTASTSTDNTVTFDNTAPSVTINQAVGQADPTNASPINFTVVFSESVTGFTNGDVTLGGTANPTTAVVTQVAPNNGTTYNVAVSGMTSDGTVTASVAAGVAQDAAGNTNTASTSTDNTVTFDNSVPSVTINQTVGQADPTNVSPINFTVVFSEPVTGFATGDVTLGGTAGANSAVVSGGPTTYNVAVSGMNTSGTVIASIPAGVATDGVGNANTASTSTDNTVTYDITAPSVTINQASGQADPTGSSPINFTAVFSEPVAGFTNSDVIIGGTAGATTAVVTGGPTTYNVAVSGMTVAGTVTASIPAGAAIDGAGNASTASTSTDNTVTFTVNQAPTIAVVRGGMCNLGNGSGGTMGTMNLSVSDPNGDTVTLTASSSNTTLVPNDKIVFGGSVANPTVTITAMPQKNQTSAVITIVADDGHGGISSVQIKVIVGTNQKETINGTNGPDMIFGLNGDDTINGNAGDDLICGGNGGGTINGGDDDDTIDGGGGDDILKGQDGNDILIGGNGKDTLEGGNGDDIMTGGSGADSFNGGPGNDTATDFTPSQGDTKTSSTEIATAPAVEGLHGVLAYLAPLPLGWVNPWWTFQL